MMYYIFERFYFMALIISCVKMSKGFSIPTSESDLLASRYTGKPNQIHHINPNPSTSHLLSTPHQYIKTPNFDVIWLKEEETNPDWIKYSSVFPTKKDLQNIPVIQVNYTEPRPKESCTKIHTVPSFPKSLQSLLLSILPKPSSKLGMSSSSSPSTYPPKATIALDQINIKSLLGSLGKKKHILVLRPRKFHLHDDGDDSDNKKSTEQLLKFKQNFLPKILQQLYKSPVSDQKNPKGNVDQMINQIIKQLDTDEKRMIADLYKTYVANEPKSRSNISKDLIKLTKESDKISNDIDTNFKTLPVTYHWQNSKSTHNVPPSNQLDTNDAAYVLQLEKKDNTCDEILLKILKLSKNNM